MPPTLAGFGSCFPKDLGGWKEYGQRDPVKWADVFQSREVHEFLFDPAQSGPPAFLARAIARHHAPGRSIIWIDPVACMYPPALGTDVESLCLIRLMGSDLVWATAESLRCKHVGVVIAMIPQSMTRVEVRRLQLAAEHGNSLGILLRPNLTSTARHIYSAASRWFISPAPGERTIQRWCVEHRHGHGRQFGPSFLVEKYRDQIHFVHPSATLVNHAAVASAS